MHILLGLALSLGVLALYIASRPAAFRIERSLTIAAPAAALYPHIVDFHKWSAWSPWDKIDPNLQRTYEGPESGVGAVYRWSGNKQVGSGSMTITDVTENARVALDLNFITPFAANNRTVFTLEAAGEGTRVTWSMEGENNFAAKAFNVFMNMDALVGKDFEKGLAALRATATATAAVA